jgi:hypothetical protein
MAQWDITVPAQTAMGGAGGSGSQTHDISGSRPSDFDGATINSVTLVGAGNVTLNTGSSNDSIGVRWNIENSVGGDTYGLTTGTDDNAIAYAPSTTFSGLPVAIAAGTTTTPAPTIAVASSWHQVRCQWTYTTSGKNDESTADSPSFTIRVDYTSTTKTASGTPSIPSIDPTGYTAIRNFVTSAEANTVGSVFTFNNPRLAAIQPNDVIVVCLQGLDATSFTDDQSGTFPFVEEVDTTHSFGTWAVYTRIAGSSEPSSYSFTAASGGGNGQLIVFRNVLTSNIWDVSPASVTPNEETVVNNIDSNSISVGSNNSIGLCLYMAEHTGSISTVQSYSQGYIDEDALLEDNQTGSLIAIGYNPNLGLVGSKPAVNVSLFATQDNLFAVQFALATEEPTPTASGTPSIPTITASGSAEYVRKASGTPSIPATTASGAAKIIKTAAATVTMAAITASGAASNLGSSHTASGTPDIPAITASGTVEVIKTASGSPSIPAATASGTAYIAPKVWLNTTQTLAGATEMTVTSFNTAGTSITFTDPTGAPTGSLFLGVENRNNGDVGWIAVTVTSGADVTASGTPDIPAITASGTAEYVRKASGTPSIPVITASGTAEIIKTASGTPSISVITASGVAEVINTASGTPSIPAITASGSAEIIKTASGTPS